MTDLTYPAHLPAGPDYPGAGSSSPHGPVSNGDGTEGPEAPVTPVPQPPGFPDVPELPDETDEAPGDEEPEPSKQRS